MHAQLAEQTIRPNMLELAHTHLTFTLGPNQFTATLYGSEYNWSLSQLGQQEYCDRLGHVLCCLNVGHAYMVDATEFNTVLHDPSCFCTSRHLGRHYLRQALGRPAEGMSLKPGDAGVQSPAGCLTIIMSRHNSQGLLAIDPLKAHAGRWSLLRPRGSNRQHESVCYSMLEKLGVDTPYEARDVWVKILWGIRQQNFPHPLADSPYANGNCWLVDYAKHSGWGGGVTVKDHTAYLDLAYIAQAQLMQRGVPERQIDLGHALLPTTGVFTQGGAGKPRNLVVIKRLH